MIGFFLSTSVDDFVCESCGLRHDGECFWGIEVVGHGFDKGSELGGDEDVIGDEAGIFSASGGDEPIGGIERSVERGDSERGFVNGVVREVDVVSVVRGEEEVPQGLGVDLFSDIAHGPEIFEGMAHFFAVDFDHSHVHPVAREVAILSAFGLSDLVFVVREDEVASAAVDIEGGGEVFGAHARAFDMPSGATAPPGRIPSGFFLGRFALPEGEIAGGFFGFVDFDADAVEHFVEVSVGEFTVVFERSDSEVDVSAGLVGISVVEEFLDELDDIGDMLRDAGFDVGLFDVDGGHVFVECVDHSRCEFFGGRAFFLGAANNFIVDIGVISDEAHVQSNFFKETTEDIEHDEGSRMTDVGKIVDGESADIDGNFSVDERFEVDFGAACRVVNFERNHENILKKKKKRLKALSREKSAVILHQKDILSIHFNDKSAFEKR